MYLFSAVKAIENAESSFQTTQDLLRNALFFKQQLKYKESQRFVSKNTCTTKSNFHPFLIKWVIMRNLKRQSWQDFVFLSEV